MLRAARTRQAQLKKEQIPTQRTATSAAESKNQGLGDSSIFSERAVAQLEEIELQSKLRFAVPPGRNAIALVQRMDPRPAARRRWEKKILARQIAHRGRLNRIQQIKRTERELMSKSQRIRTSHKKLDPLATQIAGKPIEEAILQMRFSKKKAAIAVRQHLESARIEAIVERGMGLGKAEMKTGPPVNIQLKDGTTRHIEDQTGIYVAQAWTNKSWYGSDISKRARGKRELLRLPQSSLVVLLKEEKTRIREADERKAQEAKRKVWTQHTDRSIPMQRQYYTW